MVFNREQSPAGDLGSLDLIPDPVIGVDRHRHINLWNRAAAQAYGFTRAEALGRLAPELLSTRFPIPLQEILESVSDTGGWRGDLVQRAKDGRELIVESRWITLFDARGDVSGGLEIDREPMAAIQEQSIEKAEQGSAEHPPLDAHLCDAPGRESVGALAGAIAHDFNNQLAVIINYSAIVARELEAVERASDDARWPARLLMISTTNWRDH